MNLMHFFRLEGAEKHIAIKRKIYPFFFKRKWGKCGRNSCIIKPLLISGKKSIIIGNNVLIREDARIETIFRWKNESFSPKLIIEDDTCIEERVHIVCANRVIIGKGSTLSCDIMISDNEHGSVDINRSVLEQKLIVDEVIIGENCFIGAGAKILSGVHIGKHCVVGANSVVTKDIPDYSIAVGVPAKVIKNYSFEKKQWIKV